MKREKLRTPLTTTPAWIRRAQRTDIGENNNKYYITEFYAEGVALCKYGRVGGHETVDAYYSVSSSEATEQFESKLTRRDNPYVEVELAKDKPKVAAPATVPSAYDPAVASLISFIFGQANQYINTYLSGTVDALSEGQITRALDTLKGISNMKINDPRLPRAVQEYYNLVPTKLPHKLDIADLINKLDVKEQEDRLSQLQAAISTQAATSSGVSQIDALGGTVIQAIAVNDPVFEMVDKYIKDTHDRRMNFQLYRIKLPTERAAFNANTFGKQNVRTLWHGTRSQNVRHILNKSGLRIPQAVTNGWRLGPGIYFADRFAKSYNYSDKGSRSILFLADVALGIPKTFDGSYDGKQAPAGYHSTHGTKSWGGTGDEFVVYTPPQQTIRYLLVLN